MSFADKILRHRKVEDKYTVPSLCVNFHENHQYVEYLVTNAGVKQILLKRDVIIISDNLKIQNIKIN